MTIDQNSAPSAHEVRCKRLLFRAEHRGTKELDIILGSFAREHLHQMTSHQLDRFEALLFEEEVALQAWLTGLESFEGHPDAELIGKIQQAQQHRVEAMRQSRTSNND